MNAGGYVLVLCGLVIVAAGVWLAMRLRPRSTSKRTSRYVGTAAAGSPETVARVSTYADALIIGDLENPLVEITLTDLAAEIVPLEVSSAMKNALQPLMQRAPEVLRVGSEMATKTYRVVFSPAVTRALKDGTLELLPSSKQLLPVARDIGKGKKFIEIGRIVKGDGVRWAGVAAMSWQIASIVTAQHYLGEINARLQRLEDGVADINFFQHEEKRAELRAGIYLLRQYHDAIARGDLHASETAAIYQKLEDLEHTCLAIGELARGLAKRKLDKIEKLKIREHWDRRGSAKRAKDWVKQNQDAMELIYLAQSCRVLTCQVKAALPGDRTLLNQRIAHAQKDIRDAVNRFVSCRGRFHRKAVKPLRRRRGKLLAIGGIFDSDYHRKLKRTFSGASHTATKLAQRLDTQAAQAQQFAERFDQLANSGLALDVRVDQQGSIEILSAQSA